MWKVGLNEKRIATNEEIETCVKEVIEGDRKKIKNNVTQWKESAVTECGSSDKNIEDFVSKVSCIFIL